MKSKQKDQNGFWTHFILEAYCLYDAMKDKYERIATSENAEKFFKDLRKDEKISTGKLEKILVINLAEENPETARILAAHIQINV